MSFVPDSGDDNAGYSEFEALTITRTGSFELDMAPEAALPLFTAPGEKLWVPDWDPAILHGDGYEKGTVFVTTNHGSAAYWLVCDYNTDAGHAQYARVTPGMNTGTVDVSISPGESGGTTVSVRYQLTGLSTAGNADLEESFSEASYAAMMEEWRSMILPIQFGGIM